MPKWAQTFREQAYYNGICVNLLPDEITRRLQLEKASKTRDESCPGREPTFKEPVHPVCPCQVISSTPCRGLNTLENEIKIQDEMDQRMIEGMLPEYLSEKSIVEKNKKRDWRLTNLEGHVKHLMNTSKDNEATNSSSCENCSQKNEEILQKLFALKQEVQANRTLSHTITDMEEELDRMQRKYDKDVKGFHADLACSTKTIADLTERLEKMEKRQEKMEEWKEEKMERKKERKKEKKEKKEREKEEQSRKNHYEHETRKRGHRHRDRSRSTSSKRARHH